MSEEERAKWADLMQASAQRVASKTGDVGRAVVAGLQRVDIPLSRETKEKLKEKGAGPEEVSRMLKQDMAAIEDTTGSKEVAKMLRTFADKIDNINFEKQNLEGIAPAVALEGDNLEAGAFPWSELESGEKTEEVEQAPAATLGFNEAKNSNRNAKAAMNDPVQSARLTGMSSRRPAAPRGRTPYDISASKHAAKTTTQKVAEASAKQQQKQEPKMKETSKPTKETKKKENTKEKSRDVR